VLLENKQERDKFLTYTNDNGVMTRPIWTLMNKLNMFQQLLGHESRQFAMAGG